MYIICCLICWSPYCHIISKCLIRSEYFNFDQINSTCVVWSMVAFINTLVVKTDITREYSYASSATQAKLKQKIRCFKQSKTFARLHNCWNDTIWAMRKMELIHLRNDCALTNSSDSLSYVFNLKSVLMTLSVAFCCSYLFYLL